MATIHMYGAGAIYLLFCCHQDTEYESREIEMSIYQPKITPKNISKYLWDNYIHTIQDWRICCGSSSYLRS